MTRSILHLEYDGTAYAGYQLQPDQPSIQGELEKAFFKLYQVPIRAHASGRTDAGVHASYQIVHFVPPRKLKNLNLKAALNTLLPKDIRIIDSAITDDDFHARFSARERQYRYIISTRTTALDRNRVWQIYQDLDINNMKKSAQIFIGEHDFTSFCSAQAEVDHKRCIITRSDWEKNDDHLIYHIHGNRFLHSMVRSLVGTMVEVGKSRLSVDDLKKILESKDRSSGAVTAPPQGLTLMYVAYEKKINWEGK
ncbi:MAG: tRNA pseudouridine(38-40) synthase TruA [Candidatus Marinimicrobia bacterium]|nr:tRNA pseudouridine(38-40) synthase TruA [Candidatus Neomarinimicrobiota bacterium]